MWAVDVWQTDKMFRKTANLFPKSCCQKNINKVFHHRFQMNYFGSTLTPVLKFSQASLVSLESFSGSQHVNKLKVAPIKPKL